MRLIDWETNYCYYFGVMSEGSSIQELTSRIRIETPKIEISQEAQKQKLLQDINEKTSAMAQGFLFPGDIENKFPKAVALLSKNTALLTEMANSESLGNFVTAVDTAGNFLKFYDKLDQLQKDFLQTSNRYKIKDFTNFSIYFLGNSMERVGEEIKSNSMERESKDRLVSAAVVLAKVGAGTDREKAVECLIGNIDILSKDALEDENLKKFRPNAVSLATILDTVLKYGNPDQVEVGKQWIIKTIREDKNDSVRRHVAKQIELIKFWERSSQAEKSSAIESIVSTFGVDGEQAVEAWTSTGNADIRPFDGTPAVLSRNSNFYENISALLEIESSRPGIGKVLQQEFGINDFARYPKDILIAQYDQRDMKDGIPFGVVIYPRDDYNGASYVNVSQLESLFNQLQGKSRIRIWEVRNLSQMMTVFNKSRHKYGPISFAIITGHGTPEQIAFGKKMLGRSKLEKADLERKGISSLKLAFVDNPTIILNSCSTGQLQGIGQAISEIGANVIAPIAPTNLDSISASILDDGRINFNVKYRKNISANTYSLGKQVEK